MEEFYKELDRLYAEHRYDEVENFLNGQLRIHMSCCGGVDPVQAAVYNELGSLYRNQGKAAQAADNFRMAANLTAKYCGADTAEYATVVNNLAGAYRMAGDHKNALESFRMAMDIYRTVFGTENFYYTSALNNMALLYIDTNEYDQAEKMLDSALNICARRPEMKTEQAVSLSNMAALYLKQGKDDEALKLLEQAVVIYHTLPESEGAHMAAVCNSMGDILLKKNNVSEAVGMYEQAGSITEKFFGKNAEYAITCQKTALAKYHLGEAESAIKKMDEGISCMEHLGLTGEKLYQEMLQNRISMTNQIV